MEMGWESVGTRRSGGGGEPVVKPIGVTMIILGPEVESCEISATEQSRL